MNVAGKDKVMIGQGEREESMLVLHINDIMSIG